jgi:hypothetical protein
LRDAVGGQTITSSIGVTTSGPFTCAAAIRGTRTPRSSCTVSR